jgi:3-oxoadipate enol-lactonase
MTSTFFRAALAALFVMIGAESALAATAPPPQWVRVNGVVLRYQISGRGPNVILLLPSTNKPLEYWDDIVPALAGDRRTVLRYDIRGAGMSEKLTHPITMQDEVDDLHALLDSLGIRQPVMMIGTAFGGSVELQFAAQFPDRVRAILNVSPSAELKARPRPVHPAAAQAPAGGPPPPQPDPYAMTYPAQLRGDKARFERFVGMEESNDPVSRKLVDALIFSTAFQDVTPRIRCPVLMVSTDLYPRRTAESVKLFAATIPHGSAMRIASGHDAPYETPELVLPVFRKFLKEGGF